MKKLLILFSYLFMNSLFSKDYEITPENREEAYQAEKNKEERIKHLEKIASDKEYIRLYKALLFSKDKCLLRVKRTLQGDWLENSIDFYDTTIEGRCCINDKNQDINIEQEIKNMFKWDLCEYGVKGMFFKIRLYYWLARSDLTASEKKIFEDVILGREEKLIIRDGSKLIFRDLDNKDALKTCYRPIDELFRDQFENGLPR